VSAPPYQHPIPVLLLCCILLSCGPGAKDPEAAPPPKVASAVEPSVPVIVRPHNGRIEILVLAVEPAARGDASLRVRTEDRVLVERSWDQKDLPLDLSVQPTDSVIVDFLVDGSLRGTQRVWP